MDDQGRLRVRVRAAPDGGAANKAILRTLADALDVAPSTVVLVAGASSRVKRIELDVAPGVLSARWPGLLTREE